MAALCLSGAAEYVQVQCADTDEMQPVHIEAGSMVADRCVLLPGTRVGRGAVIGSGTLIPKGFPVENESVWLGSVDGKPALWQASFQLGHSSCTVMLIRIPGYLLPWPQRAALRSAEQAQKGILKTRIQCAALYCSQQLLLSRTCELEGLPCW